MRDKLLIDGEALDVVVNIGENGAAEVSLGENKLSVTNLRREGGALSFSHNGSAYSYHVLNEPGAVQITDGMDYHRISRVEEGATESDDAKGDELTSQMPGTVLQLLVEAGTEVTKGTPLLILEAMKMEHEVCAPADGTVDGFPHVAGERVMPGDLLVEFTAKEV